MKAAKAKKTLRKLASKSEAKKIKIFFKTGKGQYAEGDLFLGIKVPLIRKVAAQFSKMSLSEINILLKSRWHEERLLALVLLTNNFQQNQNLRDAICKLYLDNTRYINNWDLVDISAPHIVGQHLLRKKKKPLYKLARSKNLWERRIAIISTFAFIRQNDFADTLKLSEILLNDTHDLIHKAVGWMLREVGKRDTDALVQFLNKHAHHMPRTSLRYAIEKFTKSKKQFYLKNTLAV
ncbi:MAG: DNA alkylation repair protein [Deltaproteobacteria bacterium]|nr:DNA alkylation repair protein [Deltaproteobacteria bacterium]